MDKNVTIIMPVKNGSNYMEEAILAIKKQNCDTEIIVVDDGSTDNTHDIALRLGCQVLKHETSKGQVVAKNTGLKYATGEFIMFCDHDDVLNDNAINTMLKEFEQNPELGVVNAKIQDFISPDAKNQNQTIKPQPYYGCLAGSMLFKKEVFDKIGLFDESIQAGEIIALMNKLKEYNIQIKKIDFVSSKRRIHDSNYGVNNQRSEYTDYARLLRQQLRVKK